MDISESEKRLILIDEICAAEFIEKIEHLTLQQILIMKIGRVKNEEQNIPNYIG